MPLHIAILQNHRDDGPAWLGEWLTAQGLRYTVFDVNQAATLPASIVGIDALAILGGPMSANDDLPGLRQTEDLIRQAREHGVPVLGHCLGGQLIARALGAPVRVNPVPEVGWHEIEMLEGPKSRAWFGDTQRATVLQWHYDSFDLPEGAVPLAVGTACRNQAFSIDDRLLAMQFHIEIDAAKLALWCATCGNELIEQVDLSTVQQAAPMLALTEKYLSASQALAARIYMHWIGLAQGRA
jgi:GMP synthase-like glutamine amidotransferase